MTTPDTRPSLVRRPVVRRLTGAVAVVALLGGLAVAGSGQLDAQTNSSETYRQLNLFGAVFERVRANYVDQVEEEKLFEAAINGMLASLDPHSSYLNAKNYRDMQVQTRGEFGGLGIEVTMENGVVKVVSPIDDTPAAKAGLKPGDLITHLDGEPVTGLALSEAVEKMRGKVGSDITLTIRRGDLEAFEVKITRATIAIRSVRHRPIGDIGYIRITTFNEQTTAGLQEAVADIKAKLGDRLHGYVIDLRNNPGGLLDQAISVSDAFLERGEIVSTRGRDEESSSRANAEAGDLTGGAPLVVIINGGSASASEIVAGALQDHRRAIVLGTQSFGKGSVQTVIPLQGYGAMRLTTARYYTPSGKSIQAKGITPDILVEPAKIEKVEQQSRREADLRGALRNPDAPPAAAPTAPAPVAPAPGNTAPGETAPKDTAPSGDSTIGTEADTPEEVDDYQLARAIDLLRGIYLYQARVVN